MHIKELNLFTDKLIENKKFYSEILGFKLIENKPDSFSIQIGFSKLIFKKSNKSHIYHYCFLIPSNQLQAAVEWLEKRLSIIEIEPGRITQRFESWNANSLYFFDGVGNIAEFIVRHDLKNETQTTFDLSHIICVNEIGMPTKNARQLNEQLEREINSPFWKGDKERFGTNGTQEGIFLLPDYELKEFWFPTSIKIAPAPFTAIVESEGNEYWIVFENEKLKTSPLIN